MRLLADQSFPASIEQNRTLEIELVRWNGERVSDMQLLHECAALGARGLMVLGVQALVGVELRPTANTLGLYLVATLETNPLVAARIVGNLLVPLAKVVKPGACHVMFARELRSWEQFQQASR